VAPPYPWTVENDRVNGLWIPNPWQLCIFSTDSLAIPANSRQDAPMVSRDRVSERSNGAVLDEVSKAIIEQLQEDGRRPYSAIGKAVGLSEAAVRQRVQRLLDSGVMQIVAVTDPLSVGFPRAAMIGVRVEGDMEEVADALETMPEVDYVVITAGSYDILVEVVCEDDDHLLDVINRRIRAIPGVRHTESFVYLKLRKQIYSWGTR
jgi:Lrp/AsnC family transcriptional regulator for asnA, asnC and gidA